MEKPKRLKTVILVSGILLLAVLSIGSIEYTSRTGFCSSCHEMNTAYTGWTKGYHADIHCYECHTDKGIIEKAKVKVNGLKEVYIHITTDVDMDKVKADVPTRRCANCHDFAKNEKKDKSVERINSFHTTHGELGFTCYTCHGDVGHTPDKFIGFKNDACKQCHLPKEQS